jgi:hypothetical protein
MDLAASPQVAVTRSARARRSGRVARFIKPDPDDTATWNPRRPSPARTTVVALQSVAMGLVALALIGTLWWLVTSSAGVASATVISAAFLVPIAGAILVVGWTGLQRWLAGGPPTRLYGFDALPILYIVATAGPGAMQDLLGLGLAAAFIVPAMATYLATEH